MKKLSLITAACVAMFAYAGATSSSVKAESKGNDFVFEQDTIPTPKDTSRTPRIPIPQEPVPLPRPDSPSPTPIPPREPAPNPIPMPTEPVPVPTPDSDPMLK